MQQDNNNIFDVIIVGGGAVGLFAMSKFVSAGFNTILFEGSIKLGGQCNLYLSKEIHNIPLYESIVASEVIEKLASNINKENIFLHTKVVEIETNNTENVDYGCIVKTSNGTFISKYVILACGNGSIFPNRLPLENAKFYEKKSIFYDVKNKQDFKDKDVVIAGGGDACIDWAIQLTDIAKSVSIIHRRNITATDNPDYQLFNNLCKIGKIKTYFSCNIVDIVGDKDTGKLKGVMIKDTENHEKMINCDYMLVFYGLKSEQILKNTDLQNVNQATMETAMNNVFSVGDFAKYVRTLIQKDMEKNSNLKIGFSEVLKCFHTICQKEKNGINMYGKSTK